MLENLSLRVPSKPSASYVLESSGFSLVPPCCGQDSGTEAGQVWGLEGFGVSNGRSKGGLNGHGAISQAVEVAKP